MVHDTIGFARPAPDNNEPSDDDTPTLSHNLKKTRLDDNLQGLASKLESLYPPGRCTMHLELACFHHWGMDSHFHLDNSAHLVWDSGLMQSYVYCLFVTAIV
jgi:hypothetical protein